MNCARPPRLARRLVAAVADPAHKDFLLDDLDEGYAPRFGRRRWAARGWYTREVAGAMIEALRHGWSRAARLRGRNVSPATIGLAAGIAIALLLTRFLAALLFEVSSSDPLTFVGVAGTLLGIALLASWLPARRAAGVDPVDGLRRE